jgi:hypothetical protein
MTQKKRATQRVILSCCSEESRRTLLRPAPARLQLSSRLAFVYRPVDAALATVFLHGVIEIPNHIA